MLSLRQVTFGQYGHTLNRRQAVSADGNWAIYDTRNDDTHIGRTDAIEMVHLDSGEVVRLYTTSNQSIHGPGVGAAAVDPASSRVIFIHGLESCDSQRPYSAARRFGAIVDFDAPDIYSHAESRLSCPDPECTSQWGVLHGGTHAHSWNHQGWISFTYNDAWLESSSQNNPKIRDQRSVGIMIPSAYETHPSIDCPDHESFVGSYDAFLATKLSYHATHGSDEIEQATEECWLGRKQSLAFLGTMRNDHGALCNEIFVCNLPEERELRKLTSLPRHLDFNTRLDPVPGCKQFRLTHSLDRPYPGIQGPRHWLVSSPDGSIVYFLTKDDVGIVQLLRVHVRNGLIEQVTDLQHSIEGQFSISADGNQCAFVCNQRICLVDLQTGEEEWLTEQSEHTLVGAVHFAGDRGWICNAIIGSEPHRYLQILACGR